MTPKHLARSEPPLHCKTALQKNDFNYATYSLRGTLEVLNSQTRSE